MLILLFSEKQMHAHFLIVISLYNCLNTRFWTTAAMSITNLPGAPVAFSTTLQLKG